MGVPVLVVHGVGNRRREPFERVVARFQERVGPDYELLPVYWGDLGASTAGFDEVLPHDDEEEGAESVGGAPDLAQVLAGAPGATGVALTTEQQAAVIAEAASSELGQEGPVPTASAEIQAAILERLPATTHLRSVQSPQALAAVGELVGRGAGPAIEADESEAPAFVGRLVHGILDGADRLVGGVTGEVLGDVNHQLRSSLVPGVAGFLGDVFAYQHHRRAIQDKIWETIDGHDATRGSGTPERPVHVVAHSLGGVISFHAATAADTDRRLFIEGFVTFGSQSGFFHLLDPRASGLEPFGSGKPVVVTGSIRRWTNLWEPLDPLAFLAGPVFRLDDGAGGSHAPHDRATAHLVSSGFFTHGSYWESDELVDAVRSTLG